MCAPTLAKFPYVNPNSACMKEGVEIFYITWQYKPGTNLVTLGK